uniref:Pyrin domain-containing protein n=1 Tax=Echeneis naucrates TaxID=173247 RepID=A0A665TT61_ECHNA
MPRGNITVILAETLADLSKDNFDHFVEQLLDRREEPRVRRNRVEGKSYLEVTTVLVSAFTESGAPQVVLELLRGIRCNSEADRLGETRRAPAALTPPVRIRVRVWCFSGLFYSSRI